MNGQDEMDMPNVDNTNVVLSEPAYTGSTPRPTAPVAPEAEEPKIEGQEEEDPTTPEAEPTEPAEADPAPAVEPEPAIDTTPKVDSVDVDRLNQLRDAGKYQPADTDLDIVDEFGNLDTTKFGEFMVKNNENVFNQALNAFKTNSDALKVEEVAWASVNKEYPELKDNPTLEKAIRGARIQDVLNNGTGDLLEIAKGIIGPIRDNKIKAVEEVNQTIKKQEALSTFKPNNAPVESAPVSLMSQLRQAIANNDTQAANRIRHAIRIERIYGKTDIET